MGRRCWGVVNESRTESLLRIVSLANPQLDEVQTARGYETAAGLAECSPRGHSVRGAALSVGPSSGLQVIVDRTFVLAIEPHRRHVPEGQDLSHDQPCDAPRRVDPIVGVEDTGPGQ